MYGFMSSLWNIEMTHLPCLPSDVKLIPEQRKRWAEDVDWNEQLWVKNKRAHICRKKRLDYKSDAKKRTQLWVPISFSLMTELFSHMLCSLTAFTWPPMSGSSFFSTFTPDLYHQLKIIQRRLQDDRVRRMQQHICDRMFCGKSSASQQLLLISWLFSWYTSEDIISPKSLVNLLR